VTGSVTTAPASADAELLELHRRGRLAADYPRVRALVHDLTGLELARAGQLLSRVSADEIAAAHPGTTAVTVAITGHSTVTGLVAPLTAELARYGWPLRPYVADFDGYVFELSDPGSGLYRAGAALTVCLLDPTIVFDEVPTPWQPDDVESVLAGKLALLERLVAAFERQSAGTLVLNTMPLPRLYTAQIVDYRSRARLGRIWRAANIALLELAERHPALTVVDLDPLVAEGVAARDPRLAVYTKSQLSPDLLAAYARELGHLVRATRGRTKKCLVLDLDNTVWGGIVGDDGIDGIEVAETYRGEAFRAIQKAAKQLGHQGVLIAAVSKNEPETVRRVLAEHPEMTLREQDFVRVIANWGPKHDNIAALAQDLNLGLDSFVFVDDSPYERALVGRELPDVTVVPLRTDPATYLPCILADGWFDARALTDEDRQRSAMYRGDLARREIRANFSSIDDYLADLAIVVELAPVAPGQYERLSQTTLRTNQFNLTTERLQPADIQTRAEDPAHLVLAVRSRDRFGDNGLVGAVLARREDDRLVIDNMLLSCRVFSRGIEESCLSALLGHAVTTGMNEVTASFRPTAKNGKVRAFLPDNGFTVAAESPEATVYRHDLAVIADVPPYIDLHASFERVAP